MILNIPVDSIQGTRNALTNAGTINMVVAAEKARKMKTINTDEVRFEYPLNGRDSRASLSVIEADEEIADMLTAADLGASPYDRDTELFPILTVSGGTPTNYAFPWADFQFAIAAQDAANESRVWFAKGNGQIEEYLVDLTLAELVTLATP